MEPTVVLFSYTNNAEKVCAAAMRSCNSPCPAFHIYKGELSGYEKEKQLTPDRVENMLQRAVTMGHMSILEHALFTFDIQNVSRSMTHQLVRHRIASYSQQSQRHVVVDTNEEWYVIPPSLRGEARKRFKERMDTIADWYKEELNQRETRTEDVRFYLPNSALTNIVLSMNPRELLHMFSLRCAMDAQWEIRAVAWAMLACCRLVAPAIFGRIPRTKHSKYLEEKERKLSEAVLRITSSFNEAKAQEVVEIPTQDLELDYRVRAFVNKL